jgi:hypothetical protein
MSALGGNDPRFGKHCSPKAVVLFAVIAGKRFDNTFD